MAALIFFNRPRSCSTMVGRSIAPQSTASALREKARDIGGGGHAPRGDEGHQRRQVCECPSIKYANSD